MRLFESYEITRRAGGLERRILRNQVKTRAFIWSTPPREMSMLNFLRRLIFHYGIYRRYPLRPLPALRNAWRNARA